MNQGKEYYCYFVEGDDDKKVVNTLKTELQVIIPGKVHKFNVIENRLNMGHLRTLRSGTIIILVFDTDTGKTSILEENIKFLKNQKIVKEVYCITQVMNLEDELVRSCSIDAIKELTKSKSNTDFKRDILRISNLKDRLEACGFECAKFWNSKPQNEYKHFSNDSDKVKKQK